MTEKDKIDAMKIAGAMFDQGFNEGIDKALNIIDNCGFWVDIRERNHLIELRNRIEKLKDGDTE